MSPKQVRRWLKENIDRKAKEFGLENWRFEILFEKKARHDDGFQPTLSVDKRFEYERAGICADANACADVLDESGLEGSLEHELLHCMHSSFDLCHEIVMESGSVSADTKEAFHVAFMKAQEMTVRNLERLVRKLRSPE